MWADIIGANKAAQQTGEDAVSNYEKLVDERKAQLDGVHDRANGLVLAALGANMAAGQSPHFFSNVGAGLQAATQQAYQNQRDMRSEEDRILEMRIKGIEARRSLAEGNLERASSLFKSMIDWKQADATMQSNAEKNRLAKLMLLQNIQAAEAKPKGGVKVDDLRKQITEQREIHNARANNARQLAESFASQLSSLMQTPENEPMRQAITAQYHEAIRQYNDAMANLADTDKKLKQLYLNSLAGDEGLNFDTEEIDRLLETQ